MLHELNLKKLGKNASIEDAREMQSTRRLDTVGPEVAPMRLAEGPRWTVRGLQWTAKGLQWTTKGLQRASKKLRQLMLSRHCVLREHKRLLAKTGVVLALGILVVAGIPLLIQSGCSAKAPEYKYADKWEPPAPRMVADNVAATGGRTTGATTSPDEAGSTMSAAEAIAGVSATDAGGNAADIAELNRARVTEVISALTGGRGHWPSVATMEWVDSAAGEEMSGKLVLTSSAIAADTVYLADKKIATKAELEILATLIAVKTPYDGVALETADTEQAREALDALIHDFAVARYLTDSEAKYLVSIYDGYYFPAGRHPHVIQ